ncbi:MAG: histidine phosphatase family protein [Planctomycetaceae bacterium]
MKLTVVKSCLIGLLAILPHSVVAADPDPSLKVVIVRHGEKPPKKDEKGNAVKDNGNLSCAGLNRSLKLPDVIVKKYGVPNHVYAPKLDTGSSTGHARMFQTASPLAALYNLKINTTFKEEATDDAAKDVKSKKKVVLMVWEHSQIPALAKSLEPKNAPPSWPDDDFDSIWILDYSSGQGVWSTDKEGIDPLKAPIIPCPSTK